MHFRIIAVDKLREPYLQAAVDDFRRRLSAYHRVEILELRAEDGRDPERAMESEGLATLKLLPAGETVWLLERSGTELSSEELARKLEAAPVSGISRITFVIAGTYGASRALIARASFLWSLSRLTFLHEWARAIVLEQLYRATKIARGEPYHH